VLHAGGCGCGGIAEAPSPGCTDGAVVSGIDEQVDVLRRADEAVKDYGETSDQEVTDPFLAECSAEVHEVLELRRAAVCAIWLIIHSSAASKEENR
jgi:hypothetical protein